MFPIPLVGEENYQVQIWITRLNGVEMPTNFYDNTNGSFITVPSSCTSGEVVFSIRNTSTSVGILFDSLAIKTIDASDLNEDDQISFSIYPNPSSDFIQMNY